MYQPRLTEFEQDHRSLLEPKKETIWTGMITINTSSVHHNKHTQLFFWAWCHLQAGRVIHNGL